MSSLGGCHKLLQFPETVEKTRHYFDSNKKFHDSPPARTWFVPVPVCDHSQGSYFPPNTGGGVWFSGFYSNKQTNKATNKQLDNPTFKKRKK